MNFGERYLPVLTCKRSGVVWGEMEPRFFGLYYLATNMIAINSNLRNERLEALAAVVAHEVIHAVNKDQIRSEAECVENEEVAMTFQSLAWFSLMANYSSDFLEVQPLTRLESFNHRLAVADYVHQDKPASAIIAREGYAEFCAQFP